jgi:hypothetical protein
MKRVILWTCYKIAKKETNYEMLYCNVTEFDGPLCSFLLSDVPYTEFRVNQNQLQPERWLQQTV